MNTEMVSNACLCIAAIFLSWIHSPTARNVAIAVFLGFLCYIWAWAPDGWSPRQLVYAATGEKIKSAFYWILCDILVLLYIASVAINRVWGVALVLLFATQVCLHIFKIYDMEKEIQYLPWLEITFKMQMTVLLFLGMVGSVRRYLYLRNKELSLSG